MKELTFPESVYLEDFDIHVTPYLTMAQVEQIAKATLQFNSHVERQMCCHMLILKHCTDIPEEFLNTVNYDLLMANDVFNCVLAEITNVDEIDSYIEQEESVSQALGTFLQGLLKTVQNLEKKVPKNTDVQKLLKKIPELSEFKNLVVKK